MRIYKKILGALFVVALSVSCNKSPMPENIGNDINIELNGKNYIQFSSGISTRGELYNGLYLDRNFAVLGYQYRAADWETASIMATPDVFVRKPELVTFNNGIYTYEDPQIWTGNNYSFFAYSPLDNNDIETDENKIVLFDDGNPKQGVPYITYTLPSFDNPAQLIDLMSGYVHTRLDYDAAGNEINEVNITMKHRLSAIDIRVRNHYQYKEPGASNGKAVAIEITELKFKPKTYTKAKIFLDGSQAEGIETRTLSYSLINGEPMNIGTTEGSDWVNITNDIGADATTFLLVPQNTSLEGTLDFSFKLKDGDTYLKDITDIDKDNNKEEEVISISYPIKNLNRTLVEGRRYYIEIYFSSDAVSVDISAADEWDDQPDVKHEFE